VRPSLPGCSGGLTIVGGNNVLGPHIESLLLNQGSPFSNIDATGNDLDNLLSGTAGGANVLSGLGGNDELWGNGAMTR
jgi:hypothetical protein